MSTEIADTIVIGAGVVGLAIARHLAQMGREVIVLEIASETLDLVFSQARVLVKGSLGIERLCHHRRPL